MNYGDAPNIQYLPTTYKTLSGTFTGYNTAFSSNLSITKPLSFSGINVKNNKVFCYPYNYIYVTNGNGENNIYKIENFSGDNITFKSIFAISIGRFRSSYTY